MYIDFKTLTSNQCYGAMVQTIVPRPIAWVLSDNGDGSYNVAPFSFFTGICSDPPLLMLSVGKKDAVEEKDTRVNIRERRNFVVHIPGTRHLEQVNTTSATLAHGQSEVDTAKLELTEIDGFALPRITDCDIAIACNLYRIDEIGRVPQAVIYGEIQSITINDALIVDHPKGRLQLDSLALDPLTRLGGSNYGGLGDVLTASRPK
ncbi:MAG: flavin reductase family protein [Arenicella sp.]|nr:flavin reductase family protein [Arenicella sp.]